MLLCALPARGWSVRGKGVWEGHGNHSLRIPGGQVYDPVYVQFDIKSCPLKLEIFKIISQEI